MNISYDIVLDCFARLVWYRFGFHCHAYNTTRTFEPLIVRLLTVNNSRCYDWKLKSGSIERAVSPKFLTSSSTWIFYGGKIMRETRIRSNPFWHRKFFSSYTSMLYININIHVLMCFYYSLNVLNIGDTIYRISHPSIIVRIMNNWRTRSFLYLSTVFQKKRKK